MRERIFFQNLDTSVAPFWYKSNSTLLYDRKFTYTKTWRYGAMIDVVTANYKERSLRGEIINNPMQSATVVFSQRPTIIQGRGYCGSNIDTYEKSFLETPDYPVMDSPSADSICEMVIADYSDKSTIAQTAAWANISVAEIAGLASLGEMPETIKFLIDIVKEIARLTIAAKRGDVKSLSKFIKSAGGSLDGIGNVWLGWRYGVRPLIFDLKAALAAVNAQLQKGIRSTARGKSVFDSTDDTVNNRSVIGLCTGTNDCTRIYSKTKRTRNVRMRAGVLFEIERNIDSLLAVWGLDDPLGAAWELIPCSFIVDWIVNISDVLNAAMVNPGLSALSSWVTEYVHYNQSTTVTGVQTTGYNCNMNDYRIATQLGVLNLDVVVKRRVPLAERYNLPRLNLKVDFAKLTDLFFIIRKLI